MHQFTPYVRQSSAYDREPLFKTLAYSKVFEGSHHAWRAATVTWPKLNRSLLRAQLQIRMMASTQLPTPNQTSHNGIKYDIVREGLAEILNPAQEVSSHTDDRKPQAQSVFYNPIQQFNRDLSVLAIRIFSEKLVESRLQKQTRRKYALEGSNKRRKLEEPSNPIEDGNGPELVKEISDDPTLTREEETNIDHHMEDVSPPNEGISDQIVVPEQYSKGVVKAPLGTKANPFQPTVRALDALSASGLRALRYAQEIPALTHVVANDISVSATKAININIKHNKQDAKISLNTGDATEYMYKSRAKFEVVDLDPYGTAGPFLDAAIQALTNGGLLCVTCTDSAVFAAAGYCEKTFAVYGGLPVKGPHSHEGGLRLILHAIATSAARYGLAIEPLLSLSIDFYIRVFVKVRKSVQEVKYLAGKTMIVYGCDSGCGSWSTQLLARTKDNIAKNGTSYHTFSLAQAPSTNSNCPHCGFLTHLHGPMWAGPIHNPYFIQSMLDTLQTLPIETYGTKPRMEGMLITARDETILSSSATTESSTSDARLPPDVIDHHPFFFIPGVLSGTLHCVAPSAAHLRGALLRLGYRVTRSHAKAGSIKTDAPWNVIWETMREWIRQERPIKEESIKSGSAAKVILEKRRDKRDSLSKVRDELKSLGESKEVSRDDIKTKLESILFRLPHQDNSTDDINGDEGNGPIAIGKKVPMHKLKIVFDEQLGKKSEEVEGKKIVRYQMNPRANWGPLSRATG